VRRESRRLYSPAIGSDGEVIAYGHWGMPVLAFGAEAGWAAQFEQTGMIDAVAGLIEAGRVKLYTVDSFDRGSWTNPDAGREDRALAHLRFEDWIVHQVVPFVHDDCGGPRDILTTGVSLGAHHAVNFAFRRGDLFPVALGLSGVYDLDHVGWGDRGDTFYFTNPMDYVAGLHGDHLDWLRSRLRVVLVCGQGMWEDTTRALESTRAFAGLLADKGINHELDLWGHDMPHDWPSWRRQLAYHLDRLT
jgi:esterase/lipase superfamily enzyme